MSICILYIYIFFFFEGLFAIELRVCLEMNRLVSCQLVIETVDGRSSDVQKTCKYCEKL